MSAEVEQLNTSSFPLAFNTRNGVTLEHAGVFRDAEGRWWSVQARKPQQQAREVLLNGVRITRQLHSHVQDGTGRIGHISFVRLTTRPHWLTEKDASNLQVALQLNQMLYKGNVKTFRTQDEADEAFQEAHEARGLFVTR